MSSPQRPPAGVRAVTVTDHHGARGARDAQQRRDWLAEEVPVALVFNGISHAVMMGSPGCNLRPHSSHSAPY